jgi:hypothetical protein
MGLKKMSKKDREVKELISTAMEYLGIGVTIIDPEGTLLH